MKEGKFTIFIIIAFVILSVCISSTRGHNEVHQKTLSAIKSKLDCDECVVAAATLRTLLFANATESEMIKLLIGFCIDYKIENGTVCEGLVDMFQEEVLYVLDSTLTTTEICGRFFGICPFSPSNPPYNVTFPVPKPPLVPYPTPSPDGPRSRFLHISDVHFDALYQVGSNSECGEPLCCRAANGMVDNSAAAGKWGSYQCDLNINLLENLLDHWKTMDVKPDAVFWTGDNPPHDIWEQTREGQINNSAFLTQALQEAFGDIPVFPCIGNHEGVPVNSYPLPPYSSWLYDALGDQWSVWLPEDAVSSFKYGGYYSANMKMGAKVVSLNMNYCNSGNVWLLLNMTDPGRMLEWLINELQESEDNNQKVYIIGHIPPGNHNCLPGWGTQFTQIIDRYEDTVRGQFYGHTHNDAFQVFFDVNSTRATSLAFVTPSVTSYKDINPSYRIYTADSSSGVLVESSTYHVNLSDANLQDSPTWELEYNATSAYSLSSLAPSAWADLIERMRDDDELFALYYYHHFSGSGGQKCDFQCKKKQICEMSSSTSHILTECMIIQELPLEMLKEGENC